LAEDNVLNQKLAVVMLESAGYQVEVAKNGKEAIDKFKNGELEQANQASVEGHWI